MLLHAFKFSWLMWIFSFVHLVAIRWWFSLFIFIDYQTYFSMSPWKCCSICWRTFLHSTFLLAGFNYSKLTMDLRLATSPVLIIWLALRRSFSNLHPSVVLLLCVKWCVIIKFRTIFRFLEKKSVLSVMSHYLPSESVSLITAAKLATDIGMKCYNSTSWKTRLD